MYSLVACLSHLTIDHASLSIPSTVPTPNRHLQHLGAHYFLIHMLHRNVLLILSPSCFAVCGHHLSPRIAIAIVLSLQSSVPNLSMPHSSIFLIPSNTSRFSYISHSPTMCSVLLLRHQRTSVHLLPPPLDYWCTSFFFVAGPDPLHEIAISAFSCSPLARADTFHH